MADSSDGPANALSPERYLAWLYSPPGQQDVLSALCGIEAEIASSVRPGVEHQVAHARLQWWHDECERTADGKPVHPLTRALVKASGGPVTGISGFVDTAVWDLASATFETRKELTAYCERWGAAMFESAAAGAGGVAGVSRTSRGLAATAGADEVSRTAESNESSWASRVAEASATAPTRPHSAPSPSASATASTRPDLTPSRSASATASTPLSSTPSSPSSAASHVSGVSATQGTWRALGAAVREIELLSNLASEAHSGRLRVPLDELERAGVDPSVVAKTPWPPALATLLRERHEALRATLASLISQFPPEAQTASRGLMVWAVLAWHQSWRAQRSLPNAILARRYHPLLDGWRAWRAARNATAGTLRLT
jgi:phytoene/squalene synthetase